MLVHSLAWRKLHGVDALLDNFTPSDVVKKYFIGCWHHHDLGMMYAYAKQSSV